MPSCALRCHPSCSSTAVHGIVVEVRRHTNGVLALSFRLEGSLARLRIPPPGAPRMGARLWQHTCFEAFVAVDGASAYHEVNLSPSGEWTVYAFERYRDGGPLDDPTQAPRIGLRRSAAGLELDAEIALAALSPQYAHAALCLGLSAVVEADDGTLSYWALHHPPGAPDFHHRDALALRLERIQPPC